MLLHNETVGGHWLQMQVEAGKGVNRQGIGSRINIYPAGKLGEASALLSCKEVSVGYGYASGRPALAHFGLGKATQGDVEVVLSHGKGTVVQKGVKANQKIGVKP